MPRVNSHKKLIYMPSPSPTLEDQERQGSWAVIDRILYKLDDLVSPAHKILVLFRRC